MREDILNMKNTALGQIMDSSTDEELGSLRIEYLGRNGKINDFLTKLKSIDKNERKEVGILINDSKKAIESALYERIEDITQKQLVSKEWFDLTIPGDKPEAGNLHAQTKVLSEILDQFNYLGYQVADGPEIERDYYNFEVLNFAKDHPARDAQQTMFFDTTGSKSKAGEWLPRTHTSAMQGRVMENIKPPFKVVVPGRCFRYEQVDASHGVDFWQVEGFAVDENIRLTDLLGTIEFVLRGVFGTDTKIRFATTFFPFVEPGIDTYIKCTVCSGAGCGFCKKSGWSEIMPAGMIHPNVLSACKIDPKQWRGFAFAIGLSRVVTLKYKIDDLRVLTNPDIRILKQY